MKYFFFQNINKKRGLSLMEVLTAVAIIAVLSSISYTAWRKYIRRAVFTEVKANLSMIFASQAKYKTTCGHYHPDLNTIGALPVGRLHYNIGASFDNTVDWRNCLTDTQANCSDCKRYFEDICVDGTTPCDRAKFEDFSNNCSCYIREDYKVSKTGLESGTHTAQNYCGLSKGVTKDKFCFLAATALNKNRTNSAQWDVWVVNHLNIIKQVASPGD